MITVNDIVLDLVQILEEVAESGRLVGAEDTRIEKVDTDAYIDRKVDRIVLTFSNGEKAELVIDVVS